MKENKSKMTKGEIFRYCLLFLYFLSITAFRLGVGFDAVFVRVMFIIMLITTFFIRRQKKTLGAFMWNGCYWILFFVSALWAANPDYIFEKVAIFIQIIGLFFFLPFYVSDKKTLNLVLKILVASLALSVVILFIRTPIEAFGTQRLGSAMGLNANALGIRMSIGVILSLYLFHDARGGSRIEKIFYLMAIVLFFAISLLSGSKKALFAIIAGVLAYEILIAKGMNTIIKILGAIVAVAMVFLLIFTNEQLYNVIGSRVEQTFATIDERDAEIGTDYSLIERRFFIEQAKELFGRYPLLGYGGNNFIEYMEETHSSYVTYSHNNYLEILSTLGVVGFVVYYAFWIFITFKLFGMYKMERKNKIRHSVLLLSLLLMIIFAILDYGMVSYDAEFNMVILCLIYMCYSIYNNKRAGDIYGENI